MLDAGGRPVPLGGGGLGKGVELELAELDYRLADVDLIIACDVDNALTGPSGPRSCTGPRRVRPPRHAASLIVT